MYGLEEMDLDLARQRHLLLLRDAELDRALAAAAPNPRAGAGLVLAAAFGGLTAGMRRWLWGAPSHHRSAASLSVK